MVDIQSVAAEIRRGKRKKKIKEEDRKKLQGKNIMAPLLHRAAIINLYTTDHIHVTMHLAICVFASINKLVICQLLTTTINHINYE